MSIAFDDIDAINAHASEEYGDWGKEVDVTQEMINDFAELTGDRQWIHIDVERCEKESPFGGPIAHGYLTMSLMPMLISVPVELCGREERRQLRLRRRPLPLARARRIDRACPVPPHRRRSPPGRHAPQLRVGHPREGQREAVTRLHVADPVSGLTGRTAVPEEPAA